LQHFAALKIFASNWNQDDVRKLVVEGGIPIAELRWVQVYETLKPTLQIEKVSLTPPYDGARPMVHVFMRSKNEKTQSAWRHITVLLPGTPFFVAEETSLNSKLWWQVGHARIPYTVFWFGETVTQKNALLVLCMHARGEDTMAFVVTVDTNMYGGGGSFTRPWQGRGCAWSDFSDGLTSVH
jgi:hypothetical protein